MRLLPGLVLGVAFALGAGSASAAPLIAACCDSLTARASNGYLPYIDAVYGAENVDDLAVGGRWSGLSRTALESYLLNQGDPEVVVVLSGTVDAYKGPYWQPGGLPYYDENETVGNIAGMVDAAINDGGEPILVAPPPVIPPCDGFEDKDPNCQEIDDRLYDLSFALEDLASSGYQDPVPFVDLYTWFDEDPRELNELLGSDGLHPNDDGDLLIAQAVLPEIETILDLDVDCNDGLDNDGDGTVDWSGGPFGEPADPGCVDASDLSERDPNLDCDDGADNDGDGTIDFGEDFGCDAPDDPSERTAPGVIACDDGVNNDADPHGLIDFPDDPGCVGPLGTTESPACNDGIDNDGDGSIDFDGGVSALGGTPADIDPQCGWAYKVKESSPVTSCGLGFELGFLLPPLTWWYRRRRSA